MIFKTKRLSTTQLEDLRFPWETITPLCRNCIPWRGGERWDLVVPSSLHGNWGSLWELGARWELTPYLDDVMGEGIAEHPVQRNALILQDVLGM